jgi:hypothetical protein
MLPNNPHPLEHCKNCRFPLPIRRPGYPGRRVGVGWKIERRFRNGVIILQYRPHIGHLFAPS